MRWVLLMALGAGLGCGAGPSTTPTADGGDRVCPEAYVCAIGCIAGPAASEEGCLAACRADTDADGRALYDGLMGCHADECADAPTPESCLFDRCASSMGACLEDARAVENPCARGEPNELGVGKPCEQVATCGGQVAWNCPYSIPPAEDRARDNLPRWCSMLCEVDADCGSSAFCWQRRSREGVIVGSCALTACRVDEEAGAD